MQAQNMEVIDENSQGCPITRSRIEDFLRNPKHPTTGNILEVIFPEKNSTSIINKFGVRYKKNNSNYWLCLHDKCGLVGGSIISLSKTATSNGTLHLHHVHNIISHKSHVRMQNKKLVESKFKLSNQSLSDNPPRWYRVQFAAWSAEKCIPYNAFEGERFGVISKGISTEHDSIDPLNLRKHQVELYISVKNILCASIEKAKLHYSIPFISINVDLYTSKTQNKKYITVRVSYNITGTMVSWNLGVREYNPTIQERDQNRASELVAIWVKNVCCDFGIDFERDILTSTSDSGSDIKRCLEEVVPTLREWCISHLMHLALSEAFGVSNDPKCSKNIPAREVIDKVRKVIETVNKSSALKRIFEDEVEKEMGNVLKLKNTATHRWASTELVLERILLLWKPLVTAYARLGYEFPLDSSFDILVEFYSVLHECRRVQILAQKMKEYCSLNVYMKMFLIWTSVLDVSKTLNLFIPSKEIEVNIVKNVTDINEITNLVRTKLRIGLSRRYYDRYHPLRALKKFQKFYSNTSDTTEFIYSSGDLRFSYILDLHGLLYPPISDGRIIKELIFSMDIDEVPDGWTSNEIKQIHYKSLITYLWKVIRDLAVRVAKSKNKPNLSKSCIDRNTSTPSKKRRISDIFGQVEDMLGMSSTESPQLQPYYPEEAVDAEIDYFLSLSMGSTSFPNKIKIERVEPDEMINWWSNQQQQLKMQYLSEVALALYALKPSSGGLECDLGAMNSILSPKRSSLSSGFTEILMMLHVNKHLIPFDPRSVQPLGSNWESYIPRREHEVEWWPDGEE